MEVWRIWHPTYGVIHDELEAIRRGKYAAKATRADPTGRPGCPLRAPSRRSASIAVRSVVKNYWSMKPSDNHLFKQRLTLSVSSALDFIAKPA
jgi:hypothetical protein